MMSGTSGHHGQNGQFRGVYAIPPTPFGDDGSLDEVSLQKCVDFCIWAGADGIVWGVNASEGIIPDRRGAGSRRRRSWSIGRQGGFRS